ncbi:heavy-metal-associated domain-containing protein [Clostridium perfringens]
MECASCAATIENMLNKMGGVENVSLDFFLRLHPTMILIGLK